MKSPRLHTPFPNARSEKRKIRAQNGRAATSPTQNPSTYTVVSFQFTSNLIALCFNNFQFSRVYIHLYHGPLKTNLVTLPPYKTEPCPGSHCNLTYGGRHIDTLSSWTISSCQATTRFLSQRRCYRCFIYTWEVIFRISTRLNYVTESLVTVYFSVCCYRQLY